jgi:uncharacterized membrane protein
MHSIMNDKLVLVVILVIRFPLCQSVVSAATCCSPPFKQEAWQMPVFGELASNQSNAFYEVIHLIQHLAWLGFGFGPLNRI